MNARLAGAVLVLVMLAAFAALTKTRPESWNDMSRVAAIESLVERGTWAIDDSPWAETTADKVLLGDRFYSDKMPLLSAIGAGVYALTRATAGATLAADCRETGRVCGYYWLTLLLVGLPAAGMVGFFYLFGLGRQLPVWKAALGAGTAGLGSMVWPYSLVLNHHLPAAVCLFASFYLLTRPAQPDGRWRRVAWFGAGLLAAVAVSFDILAGVMAGALGVVAILRARREATYFILGALAPVALTAWLDLQIAGTILPPYLLTQGYDYPGSQFPTTIAGNGTPDDLPRYAFRMFLGAQGLFAYNPLLLLALAGAIGTAVGRRDPLWQEAGLVAGAFVLLMGYLTFNTGNYGGVAYGERWFLSAVPVLLAFLFSTPPLRAGRFNLFLWPVFLAALTVSVLSSYQGALHPWLYSPPAVQMTWTAGTLQFGWKWNMVFPVR